MYKEKERLIIYGNGKIAKIMYYYLVEQYTVVAYTVEKRFKGVDVFDNLPFVEFENIEDTFYPKDYKFLIAVGYKQLNGVREKIYFQVKNKGFKFINYIHPSVSLHKNVIIGENNIFLENVVIQPFSRIGNNNVFWSNCVVAHGVKVGNSNWIASGSVIAGDTSIGSNCFLGVNSSIGHNIEIKDKCIIGANTLVNKSIGENSVVISKNGEKLKMDSLNFLRFSGM